MVEVATRARHDHDLAIFLAAGRTCRDSRRSARSSPSSGIANMSWANRPGGCSAILVLDAPDGGILRVLDAAPSVRDPPGGRLGRARQVEFERVYFFTTAAHAVASCVRPAGETWRSSGRDRAGKSTALSLLHRVRSAVRRVRIDGPTFAISACVGAAEIGVVFGSSCSTDCSRRTARRKPDASRPTDRGLQERAGLGFISQSPEASHQCRRARAALVARAPALAIAAHPERPADPALARPQSLEYDRSKCRPRSTR